MAEVYGEIGGQPVELNNAATEATLKALLATMTAVLNNQSKDTKKDKKIQSDLEAELRKLAKASKDSAKAREKETDVIKDNTGEQKKAAAAQKKLTDELEDTAQALQAVSGGLERAVLGLTGMVSSFANLGNSVSSAAAALNHIPIAGKLLSGVFGAVAGAAEKSYKAFQQSSSVGATFGGSITSMVNAAGEAGLTFEAFSAIIAKNGENLAVLGAGTEDGARKLARFGKEIKNTNLGNQLARLGYSTEDINEGFLKYAGYMAKSGRSQADIDKNLVAETGQYLKNLDAVSKLTGKNKEALQAEADARRQDSQFRIAEQKLNKDDRKNLDLLMGSMTKTEQAAFKGALATGTMNEEMVQLNTVAPGMAKALMETATKARASGRLSEASVLSLDKTLTDAAKASEKNSTLQTAGAYIQGEYNNSVVDVLDRSARTSDMQVQFANQAKASTQTLKDGLKPEEMKAMQERIAGISNKFNVLLADQMPRLEIAFDALASATPALVTVFTFLMNNIKTVIATFVALKVAQMAYKAALVIQKNKEATWGKTAGDARYVNDIGGGGGGGDGRGKRGKGKGKVKVPAKAAGAVLGRLAGPAAAAVAIGGAAMELSDINDELKAGRISEEEANKKKAEAAGGGIGGAGGGIAGAMAGAAIGSVVPVVGTVIGGIIGGAIGAWGGEALGRKAGSAIGGPKPAAPPGTAVTSDASSAAYLKTVAMLESGGNANAKAGTSSASGMFQFTEGTWKQMTKEMGKNYSLDDRFDPNKSAEVMSYFTNKQKAQLEKGTGRSASSTDMYMAHFLGAGGATKFLNNMQTNPNQSAAAMDPKAAAANKSIFYDQTGRERSLQEVYGLMAKKVGSAEQKVASGNVPISVAGLGNTAGFTPTATALAAMNTPSAATPSSASSASAASAFPTATNTAKEKFAAANRSMTVGQESAETLLSSLNNKMDLLIQIQSGAKDTNEKQLRAQRSMANVDMFTNVPIA